MVLRNGKRALTLLGEDGQPDKQVLVLPRGFVFSFERIGGVLVGTHAVVTDRQQDLLDSRFDDLAVEWEQDDQSLSGKVPIR